MANESAGPDYNQVGFDNNLIRQADSGGLLATSSQLRSPLAVDAEADASDKKGYTALALVKTIKQSVTFPLTHGSLVTPTLLPHGLGFEPADVKASVLIPSIGPSPYPIPNITATYGTSSLTISKWWRIGYWDKNNVAMYFDMSDTQWVTFGNRVYEITLKLYQEIAV